MYAHFEFRLNVFVDFKQNWSIKNKNVHCLDFATIITATYVYVNMSNWIQSFDIGINSIHWRTSVQYIKTNEA